MATVTGLTAARMIEIEANSVVGGSVVGGNLILEKHNSETIDAGPVTGDTGGVGPTGPSTLLDHSTKTSAQTISSDFWTYITGLTASFTAETGRLYKVSFHMPVQRTINDGDIYIAVLDDSDDSRILGWDGGEIAVLGRATADAVGIFSFPAGTVNLSMAGQTSLTEFGVQCAADHPGFLIVEVVT